MSLPALLQKVLMDEVVAWGLMSAGRRESAERPTQRLPAGEVFERSTSARRRQGTRDDEVRARFLDKDVFLERAKPASPKANRSLARKSFEVLWQCES